MFGPKRGCFPFKIFPLGNPEKVMEKDEAKDVLPIFKKSGETNFGKIFHVQAVTAFSPTPDWL